MYSIAGLGGHVPINPLFSSQLVAAVRALREMGIHAAPLTVADSCR